ncbi:hypothetical protein Syun_004744 [Stephania yunnanensis]|uniref:Uncharacterized protein n=1 Tax=Stephania yunnanensis TaxID=152371 RepID=A0AAP0L3K1_9MAGN
MKWAEDHNVMTECRSFDEQGQGKVLPATTSEIVEPARTVDHVAHGARMVTYGSKGSDDIVGSAHGPPLQAASTLWAGPSEDFVETFRD